MSLGVADGLTLVTTSGDNTWDGTQTFSTEAIFESDIRVTGSIARPSGGGASSLIISGGGATTNGASIRLYGGTHATQASDVEWRRNGTVQFHYDYSNTYLDMKANDIKFDSGQGIDFSATADGTGTTSSEVFDDYEEGTFTPVLSDGANADATYTTQLGRYTKIGNMVFFTMDIHVSALGTISGALKITGLPFTASSANTRPGGAYCVQLSGMATPSNNAPLIGRISASATEMALVKKNSTTGYANFLDTEWSATGDAQLVGQYEV